MLLCTYSSLHQRYRLFTFASHSETGVCVLVRVLRCPYSVTESTAQLRTTGPITTFMFYYYNPAVSRSARTAADLSPCQYVGTSYLFLSKRFTFILWQLKTGADREKSGNSVVSSEERRRGRQNKCGRPPGSFTNGRPIACRCSLPDGRSYNLCCS